MATAWPGRAGDLELARPGGSGGPGGPADAGVLRFGPGDCLIFDNTRVRHGRTAFTGAGGRHLQGCYADLDSLASTLAVLEREAG